MVNMGLGGRGVNALQFEGRDGGEKIQTAMDGFGKERKVIYVGPEGPDRDGLWIVSKTLRIPSHTTLVLAGARLFFADSVNDNIIRNVSAESREDRRDTDIHIIGLGEAVIDGNAANQTRQKSVHRNFGIFFYRVDDSSIQGITLGPTAAWGMSLENVNRILVDRIRFNQDGKATNQDGIHVCGPGSQVSISNIIGIVGDDAVAIDSCACAEDYRGNCLGQGGFLTGVVVNNISVHNIRDGAVLRTVAARGKPLDGVYASNLVIRGSNQVLKIGWDRYMARKGGYCDDIFPLADEHKNIYINGVQGSTDDVFCRIESNVKNLTIRGVRGTCGNAAFSNICDIPYCFSMENVLLDDWKLVGAKTALDIGGNVECLGLTIRDSRFVSGEKGGEIGINVRGMGNALSLENLSLTNVVFDGFRTGIRIGPDVNICNRICMRDVDFIHADTLCEEGLEVISINGTGIDSRATDPQETKIWKTGDRVLFTAVRGKYSPGLYTLLTDGKWIGESL